MVRVLLVGNGAREHAIAEAIRNSESAELYAFMSSKNPGIARLCKEFAIGNIEQPAPIGEWAVKKKIELAFVSPDAVLAAGVSDELWKNDIPTVGPLRAAARIEWDKGFARQLMKRYEIRGNPEFGIFREEEKAHDFIDQFQDVAVKPTGLTGGKGVQVTGVQLKDAGGAKKYVSEVLSKNIGGLGAVILEEKLIGEEFTYQAFVDGENIVGMPLVQDHKLAYEGDKGPNTGGMGSYSDANHSLPFLTEKDKQDAFSVMRQTINALKSEGIIYKGILYGQFIATADGVKVIEFNSRFGDPEAINVLPLLKTDFIDILRQIVCGDLGSVEFEKKATVCKYLVPKGYPVSPEKNKEILVDEKGIRAVGARLYYASVDEREGKIYTGSSRTVALVGIADSIDRAEKKAEASISKIRGSLFHRSDIGTAELIQKRIDHVKTLRGK